MRHTCQAVIAVGYMVATHGTEFDHFQDVPMLTEVAEAAFWDNAVTFDKF